MNLQRYSDRGTGGGAVTIGDMFGEMFANASRGSGKSGGKKRRRNEEEDEDLYDLEDDFDPTDVDAEADASETEEE